MTLLATVIVLAGCAQKPVVDAALAAQGEKLADSCGACHQYTPGEGHIGPSLSRVFNRKAASEPGFAYSEALKASGLVWDEPTLTLYLADPQAAVPGTNMVLSPIEPAQARAIVEFLKTK